MMSILGCRLKCQRESQGNALISPLLEDMKLWEKMIKQTLCILKCKKGILKNRAEIVARNVNEEFEAFKPYDYIQLCYFKVTFFSNINNLYDISKSSFLHHFYLE